MPAGDLRFEIIVDDQGTPRIQKFERVAKDADKKVKESGKQRSKETADAWGKAHQDMTQGWSKWKTVALGALGAVGAYKLAGWAKKTAYGFLEVAEGTETLRMRLETLLRDAGMAGKVFDELRNYASRVPFELNEINEAAAALAGVFKGTPEAIGKEITKWMPLVGDLAAATGMNIEQVTSQVMRMLGGGAAAADMFRERGVLAMLGFQQGVSYSAEETKKKLWEAWTSVESRFKGATERMAKSWKGLVSMFKDAWFNFRMAVMEADVFETLKLSAGRLLDKINDLKEQGKLDEWAQKVAKGALQAFDVLIRSVGKIILLFARAGQTIHGIGLEYQRWNIPALEKNLDRLIERKNKLLTETTYLSKATERQKTEYANLEIAINNYREMLDKAQKSEQSHLDLLSLAEDVERMCTEGVSAFVKELESLRTTTDKVADSQEKLTKNLKASGKAAFDFKKYIESSKLYHGVIGIDTEKIFGKISGWFTQDLPRAIDVGINWFAKGWQEKGVSAFRKFGNAVTSMLSGMVGSFRGIFGTIEGLFTGGKTGKEFFKGGLEGITGAIGQIVGMIPGIGQAIGALMGTLKSIGKGIARLFGWSPEWEKIGKEVGRDLGGEISENLAKKIEETAKEMGDRFGAITYHLAEIIDEVGLTADNFDTFAHRAHDALVMVGQGIFTTDDAAKTLNETFPKLVKAAEDFGITMNRELIDIIIHSRQMGIEIKEVTEYVKNQLGTATDALKKMVTGFTSGSQEEFDRLSRLTLAVFNEMAANGASMIEQFDALKDVIGMLAQKQGEMGLAGSEAFNQLKRFQNLVETNRELVESVSAVGDMMTALGNIGALTEQSFADLTAQAMGGFDKLAEAGFTSQESLTMMLPTLKSIQQAHETYGFAIDENTQKLLEQAEALGLLESSDPAEIMREGFEDVVTAINRLTDALVGHSLLTALQQCANEAGALGGQLGDTFDPSQVEGFSDKMDAIRKKMQLIQAETDITRRGLRGMGDELGGGFFPGGKERMVSYQHGTPYVPYTGPAIVHRGEQVIPAKQNRTGGQQEIHLHIDKLVIQAGGINFETQLFREISMATKDGRLKIHRVASREF